MKYQPPPVSPSSIPKNFNLATDIVDYWARSSPSQVAIHWTNQNFSEERKLTYSYFSRQSRRIATLLTSLGVAQGETCIVILPRIPEWWEIATACLRAGIILCPCTTLLVDKDIEFRLQISKATTFVGDEVAISKVLRIWKNCPQLRTVIQIGGNQSQSSGVINFHKALSVVPENVDFARPESLRAESPGLIFFTSGTTGPPKMVLHSQISYPLASALTGVHWLQLSPSSVYWNLAEQGWGKAAWAYFATWNCGGTQFVHDDRLPFEPQRTLTVLAKFPITTLCAPPTAYRQLVLKEYTRFFQDPRMKSLVHACSAGEPMNDSVIAKWKDLTGVDIYDGYGQTETILICANQAINPIRYGSMGKPIPGVPLVVIDANGAVTKNNQEGDIALEIRQNNSFFGLFDGYISPETGGLDRRIKSFSNGSQYYLTGDRAHRDSEGYLWFVGRGDDVINSSGYRIGPFEVESTLKQHPSVVESAVVPAPDPKRDEVVKAFIVLTDESAQGIANSTARRDALVKELQNFCKKNAAPYKYPRQIEFVDAAFLPKTISGKIKRADLRKLEKERYLARLKKLDRARL